MDDAFIDACTNAGTDGMSFPAVAFLLGSMSLDPYFVSIDDDGFEAESRENASNEEGGVSRLESDLGGSR